MFPIMAAATIEPHVYRRSAGDEPLPGYRLISPLGRGGFGEVWKCLAPGGLQKAIKFVVEDPETRNDNTPLRQEYEAFLRMKGIRHPFLLTLERVELLSGELVMVMELADKNLQQRFQECRSAGHQGIPRSELLSYMLDASEALDLLSRKHKLQHLDVKPANLFYVGGHVKVGDYGLVARFEAGGGKGRLGRGLTPKYVAPEILQNQVDSRSDQYLLALVYFELLTGAFPFEARTAEQMLAAHASAPPNLEPLGVNDRETLRRALAKSPNERFSSCLEFVKELMTYHTPEPSATPVSIPMPPLQLTRSGVMPGLTTTQTRWNSSPSLETTLPARPMSRSQSDLNISSIQRTGSAPDTIDEVTRAFPSYVVSEELENSVRGRVVRASDANQRSHRVQILKLGLNAAADTENIIRAAITPQAGIHQSVSIPRPRTIAFSVPEELTTLRDLEKQHASNGTGILRQELLEILAVAAKALDDAHRRTRFAHGLLDPSQIIAHPKRRGITGYGIGELLRTTQGDQDWITRDPYAAPEARQGAARPASDVFSLAMIYLEMIKLWSPAQPRRQGNAGVSLSAASAEERQVLQKALATKASDRYSTCIEFIAALNAGQSQVRALDEVRIVEAVARLRGERSAIELPPPARFFELLGKELPPIPFPRTPTTAARQPDGRWAFRFPVFLKRDLLLIKLNGLIEEHHWEQVPLTANSFLLRRPSRSGTPGVELTIQYPAAVQWNAAEVVVYGRQMGGLESSQAKAPPVVVEMMEHFRRAMQTLEDRRPHSRRRVELSLNLYPVDDELRVQPMISARTRDISASGLSCFLSEPMPTSHFFVVFPQFDSLSDYAVLCQTVRESADGSEPLLAGKFLG
ncbi:MAG: protein kinase domain-containing protein [Fimbriiglobus sp.]